MPHTYVHSSQEEARQGNLLGALALAVSDRVQAGADESAGHGGSAAAALVSLAEYLDGQPIEALREPLGLSHSAAVRVVDRLAEAGLVSRRQGGDRRSVAVKLTADGRRAAARAAVGRAVTLEAALDSLTAAERARLARLHEKILEGLTDSRESARRTCRLCDTGACGYEEGRCPTTRAADALEAEG
jgi:DNA-binding MarR family transcriptional regulator